MITSYLAQIAEPSTSYVWKQKGKMGTEPSLQVRPPTRTVAVKFGMGPGPKLPITQQPWWHRLGGRAPGLLESREGLLRSLGEEEEEEEGLLTNNE